MTCITPSGSSGVTKDFVGLNVLVNDPIELDIGSHGEFSNTMGYDGTPSYSLDNSVLSEATVLPVLNIHRNGIWGHNSWKQLRVGENALIRYHRRNNIISTNMDEVEKTVVIDTGNLPIIEQVVILDPTPKFYFEPVFNPSNYPLELVFLVPRQVYERDDNPTLDVRGLSVPETTTKFFSVKYKIGFNNKIQFFANEKLNYYTTQISPTQYNLMKLMYLNGGLSRNGYKFYHLKYRHGLFPTEENVGFKHIRERLNFNSGYWRDLRTNRTTEGPDGFTISTEHKSIWPLDVSEGWQTRTGNVLDTLGKQNVTETNSFGSLWNNYSFADKVAGRPGIPANVMRPAAYYSRRHILINSQSVANPSGRTDLIPSSNLSANEQFSGEAFWDMPNLSNRKPFYDSIQDFSDEIKRKYKDHSIVPEFIMNDHIDFYEERGEADLNRYDLFEITGGHSERSISNQTDFYNTYSTTEFLKNFDLVKREHEGFADPNIITLRCKAVKKLLPYEGFYPVQRTKKLAEIFYDSYYENFQNNKIGGLSNSFSFQNLIQPLFAPGVLFNTIKSGVACDFMTILHNTGSLGSNDSSLYLSSSSIVDRVPFEGIYEPEKYLSRNLNLTEADENCRLHPNTVIDSLSFWDGEGRDNYKKAINNFLAETNEFFMKKKNLTRITSKTQNKFLTATAGKTYGLRVRMFRTMDGLGEKITSGSFDYRPPQDIGSARETITMYSRPSAFGTAIATGSSSTYKSEFGDFGSSNGYNLPYTAPYYHGQAWADVYFTAAESKKYTIDEIFNSATVEYYRVYNHTTSSTFKPDTINKFAMQITASINLFNKAELPQINPAAIEVGARTSNINNTADDNSVWTIQTKFETPILNFNSVQTSSLTMPDSGSATVPIGMWHQSGTLPANNEGIYLQVVEIPVEWKAVKNPDSDYRSTLIKARATGSLADMVGFETDKVRLGELASFKTIHEAVVAIPYYDEDGIRNFYRLDPNLVEAARQGAPETNSVKKLINTMNKYVFPPSFDFINFPDSVDPISMYVFEFSHKLSKDDLSMIWQNVMPEISTQHEEQEASISHPLLANELRIGRDGEKIDSKVRWLVFKVKQRAATNYRNKLISKSGVLEPKSRGLSNEPTAINPNLIELDPIQYNWPYDFFSLVELIKMDASVEFCDIDSETGGIVPITGE